MKSDPVHVDDFIDDYKGDKYARWILMHFRCSAVCQRDFAEFIKGRLLFCDYEGRRHRCIGASRMGDVWLTSNLSTSGDGFPYEHRVDVKACSNWSDKAEG